MLSKIDAKERDSQDGWDCDEVGDYGQDDRQRLEAERIGELNLL